MIAKGVAAADFVKRAAEKGTLVVVFGGAEGAVWLALFGDEKQLEKAEGVIASVSGEPGFC